MPVAISEKPPRCTAVFGFDDIPPAPPPNVLATPGPYPFDGVGSANSFFFVEN